MDEGRAMAEEGSAGLTVRDLWNAGGVVVLCGR